VLPLRDHDGAAKSNGEVGVSGALRPQCAPEQPERGSSGREVPLASRRLGLPPFDTPDLVDLFAAGGP